VSGGYVLEIAPGAEGDIAAAFNWYRERNALIADAFRAEVFDTIERIADRLRRDRMSKAIASACCIGSRIRSSTTCWTAR
jgi:hypothetical protein